MSAGTRSVFRAATISLGLVIAVFLLIIWLGPNQSIGFMRIKVINDTDRTVKIQPCWDRPCVDRSGVDPVLVPPHRSPIVGGDQYQWPNDIWEEVTIGVVKPKAVVVAPPDRCVVRAFPPGTKVGVFRVSDRTIVPCPESASGGGLG